MKFKRLRSKGGKEVSELHRPKVGIRSLQGVGTVQNYVLLRITSAQHIFASRRESFATFYQTCT